MNNINKKKNEYNIEYNAKNYKQLKAFIKPDDYLTIDNYCKNSNISKARFIVAACKYCIDNNIDPVAAGAEQQEK